MEKISSIIPNNSRVKSVDVQDSHPVRPGTPSFGRPVGTTAQGREQMRNHLAEQKQQELDKVTISDAAAAMSKVGNESAQVSESPVSTVKMTKEPSITQNLGLPDSVRSFMTPPPQEGPEEVSPETFEKISDSLPAREVVAKSVAPSFFPEMRPTKSSAHTLDKYA